MGRRKGEGERKEEERLEEPGLSSSPLLHHSSLGDSPQSFPFVSHMTKAHGSCQLTPLATWLRLPSSSSLLRAQRPCRLGTEHTHLPLSQHTKKVLCGDQAGGDFKSSTFLHPHWYQPSSLLSTLLYHLNSLLALAFF